MTTVELESVRSAIIQSNQLNGSVSIKKEHLQQIQDYDGKLGFIPSLLRILDSKDPAGMAMSSNDRQLSAILLKNSVLRIIQSEETRRRHSEELELVKQFLLRSFGETQHQVFIQFHTITSKLARIYWPDQWPELIPSLLSIIEHENNFMQSFEATCCLHEIMIELASKASCCGSFYPIYYELCLQLFQPMARFWAVRMKSIQSYLVSFTQRIRQFSASDGFANQSNYFRDEAQESSIFHAIVMAKVLITIIETAYVDIVKRFPCFNCLWKTYMGSIQISSLFIRTVRPQYADIVKFLEQAKQQSTTATSHDGFDTNSFAANGNVNTNVNVSLLERFHSLDVDDFNHSSDFYFPLMQHTHLLSEGCRGLIVVINLIMKLIKVLNCLPIHLQKKYPLEVVPILENLVHFYYKFQIEEISTDPVQNQGLLTLPLTLPTFASALVLSNIISCSAYKDYNLYRNSRSDQRLLSRPLTHGCEISVGQQAPSIQTETSMDETVIEGNVARANEFIKEFFNAVRVKELLERQLIFTFHYNPHALDVWKNSPEKFFIDEEYSEGMCVDYLYLRHASERLFLALLDVQPTIVIEIIMNLLQDVGRQVTVTCTDTQCISNSEILLWDAVYTVTGLGAEKLAERFGVSPTEWLLKIIGPLFNNLLHSSNCGALQPSGQQILRARMLKLISAWASHFDISVHSVILEFLVNLLSLNSNSDVVVQLAAVKALSSLINLKNFQHVTLIPVALPCINALVRLVQCNLQESETKGLVLFLIKDIIQLVGVQILDPTHQVSTEYILQLGDYIFNLWNNLDNDDIARCSILEVLVTFVQSAKETCTISREMEGPPLLEKLLSVIMDCQSHRYCRLVVQHQASDSNDRLPRKFQCNDTYLCMESLLLLNCVVRNIDKQNSSPKTFEMFTGLLDGISTNVLSLAAEDDSLLSKFENEGNLRIVVDRICKFVEAYGILYGELLIHYPTATTSLERVFRQMSSQLPPKSMSSILHAMEVLLIAAPCIMAEIFFQSGALTVAINICCSQASCQNLSGLMKSYAVGQHLTFSAANVINLFILDAPAVLIKGLQIVKQEILDFLFRVSGVTNTNLCEGIILNELICVLLAASRLSDGCTGSKALAIFRLKNYCLALWSFIRPSESSRPLKTESSSDHCLPALFPLDNMRMWLKDIFQLIARYAQMCNEFFDSTRTESWKEEYYNQLVTTITGYYPPVPLASRDIENLLPSPTETVTSADVQDENMFSRVMYSLKHSDNRFRSFHEQFRAVFQSQGMRLQHVNHGDQIIEREDLIVQYYLSQLFNDKSQQLSLYNFLQQRLPSIQSKFGEEHCIHLLSPTLD